MLYHPFVPSVFTALSYCAIFLYFFSARLRNKTKLKLNCSEAYFHMTVSGAADAMALSVLVKRITALRMLNSTRANRDKKIESIFLVSSKNKQELVKKDLRVSSFQPSLKN